MGRSRSQVMRLLLGCSEPADHAGIGRSGIEGAGDRARGATCRSSGGCIVERALPVPDRIIFIRSILGTATEVHISIAREDRRAIVEPVAVSSVTFQGTEFVSSSTKLVTDPLIPVPRSFSSPNLAVNLAAAVKWPTAESECTPAVKVLVTYLPAAGPA